MQTGWGLGYGILNSLTLEWNTDIKGGEAFF